MPLFCASCPLSRESSHVVAILTDWCQICLLLISSNTHCQLQCIPWLGLVLFQLGWWTPLFRQQSLLVILSHIVGHSSKLCWKKQRELSAARKAWRASLSGDLLALFGSWDFPLFQRLLDEAGYEDKHLLHDISCLPLTGLAPVSGVLSPKSVHETVSLSEFWSKVPQRNVEVFNRVGPTGDSELDRRASDKTHEEFALGLMDGPYNSLEECPGQHKVLVRRKPRWQSGDVRNIDDCSENGINETFESKET